LNRFRFFFFNSVWFFFYKNRTEPKMITPTFNYTFNISNTNKIFFRWIFIIIIKIIIFITQIIILIIPRIFITHIIIFFILKIWIIIKIIILQHK
jgi:hypothetical protein